MIWMSIRLPCSDVLMLNLFQRFIISQRHSREIGNLVSELRFPVKLGMTVVNYKNKQQ